MSFKDAMEHAALLAQAREAEEHLKLQETVELAKKLLVELGVLSPEEKPEFEVLESVTELSISLSVETVCDVSVSLELVSRKENGYYLSLYSIGYRPGFVIPELRHFIPEAVLLDKETSTDQILLELYSRWTSIQHYCRCAQSRQQEAKEMRVREKEAQERAYSLDLAYVRYMEEKEANRKVGLFEKMQRVLRGEL